MKKFYKIFIIIVLIRCSSKRIINIVINVSLVVMSNIPLLILDEYAKTISYKQAKRLYESKCSNKYKKTIYKGTEYQNKTSYSVYLDNYILNEAKLNVNTALARYASKYNLQYNLVKEGVYFYTPLADNYIGLLENLVKDGVNKKLLCQDVDESTASYIQNKF